MPTVRLPWRTRNGGPLPIHPLLIAAYPALYLFGQNAAEQVTLDPLWGPLLLSMAIGAAVLLLLTLILRDPLRAGLLASVAIGLFFGYGWVWNAVGETLSSQTPLLVGWGALAVAGLGLAWFARRWTVPLTRGLNAMGAVAVLVNVVIIGSQQLPGPTIAVAGPLTGQIDPSASVPAHRPDIYFIILDRYAGLETLATEYGYDNEPFYQALEERGFATARDSHANYIKTPLSLAGTLGMEYLDQAALQEEARSGEDRGPIHRRLQDHLAVPVGLKALGYEYIQVASWWEPTRTNVDVDRLYRFEGESEFSSVFWRTTLMRTFYDPSGQLDRYDWRVLRHHTETELEAMERIPELDDPKFVFAHFLLPHDPYVFDADGSFMDHPQVEAQGQAESYLRQLQFVNQRFLEIIDRIVAASDEPPIIILQGDEGPFPDPYRADEWGFDWREASDAQLVEKFGILNAVLLPGVNAEAAGWHDAITPVNTFRIVFNEYFGADLPLLPDRSWAHEDLYRFYEFFEITDRLAS